MTPDSTLLAPPISTRETANVVGKSPLELVRHLDDNQSTEVAEAIDPRTILPPELWPNIDHLVFDDGAPVDSIFNERQQHLLVDPLHISWKGSPGGNGKFAAMSNVGLFGSPVIKPLVPDLTLSVDVDVHRDPYPREHRSYLIWVYGKPPDLVAEVVSDTRGGELDRKLEDYAFLGVPYYVVYDPFHILSEVTVHLFEKRGRSYRRKENLFIEDLGIGVTTWQGVYMRTEALWLRWCYADGTLLLTGEEAKAQARADANRAQANADQARNDASRAQADADQARNDANRALADANKAKADADQARNDANRAQADADQARNDANQARTDASRAQADADQARTEAASEALAKQEAERAREKERQRSERLAAQLRSLGIEPLNT